MAHHFFLELHDFCLVIFIVMGIFSLKLLVSVLPFFVIGAIIWAVLIQVFWITMTIRAANKAASGDLDLYPKLPFSNDMQIAARRLTTEQHIYFKKGTLKDWLLATFFAVFIVLMIMFIFLFIY